MLQAIPGQNRDDINRDDIVKVVKNENNILHLDVVAVSRIPRW